MVEAQPQYAARGPRRRSLLVVALLLVGLGLLANAAVLLFRPAANPMDYLIQQARAQADAPRMLGARGLYMSPLQLGPSTYGLAVMDVEAQTFALYRVQPEPARLRLMAVRAFRNDLLLTDLNNDAPTPHDVQVLVERQRERERIEGKSGGGPATTQP